ncbi:branched-chain amino acid ABC transporter permease [Oscillospiraceae bacterium MB08-C2-2]|nr:branched-chain amino acid ABC transporter permease [Oscillospiraceae bacterium MB08-C2-2]
MGMLQFLLSYLINNTFILMIGMLSVYLLTSLTGMLSMGQASFMAVGGYAAAIVSKYLHMPLIVSMIVAMAAGALFGLLIGLPAVRLRRDYVAIVSLGFGEALVAFLNNFSTFTGGAMGITNIPKYTNKTIICVVLVVLVALIWNFKKSRFGRFCIAIKGDELAAASMGINVARIKLLIFVMAGAISALGGSIYVHTTTYLDPAAFGWDQSSMWIIMVFFGGVNSLTGSLVAGIVLGLIPELLRFSNELRMIIYCVLVLLAVNFRPQGLFGTTEWDIATIRRGFKKLANQLGRGNRNAVGNK